MAATVFVSRSRKSATLRTHEFKRSAGFYFSVDAKSSAVQPFLVTPADDGFAVELSEPVISNRIFPPAFSHWGTSCAAEHYGL